MNLARISVNNPVTVNTVMCTVIVLGILSLYRLPREYLPDITFNMAVIVVEWPGASPEDVEKLITIPVEEEIQDLESIDFILSKSSEGRSASFIRYEDMSESDFKVAFQDLKSAVNEVTDLPEDAEDPVIFDLETGALMPSLQVTITGNLSERQLKKLADEFKDRLLEIDHIAKIELTGIRDREIWVTVDPDRLFSYGLSLEQVVHALQATNFNMPGGTLDHGSSEYLIRTVGEYDRPQAITTVIVSADPEGRHVKIGHIAQVQETFERPRTLSFFNRKPGVSFNISKKRKGSTIAIVDQIKELAREFEQTRLPPECRILMSNDSSIQIRDAMRKLSSNAVMGTVFVVLLLCLFIGKRNALFAAIGIPVSLMCTFMFMDLTGASINTSSLFALMMVIGIIVDDAIVIIENCCRYMQRGMRPAEAAVVGTSEVMGPVFTACLTTIAAFVPLMLLPDIIGKFLRVVPVVVCLALTASLLEAFLMLPSHIADWSGTAEYSPVRERVLTALRNLYTRRLTFVLRHRYAFVGSVGAVLLGCCSLLLFGIIDVDMYSMEEISQFYVQVHMPEGTNLEQTNATLAEIERRLFTELPRAEVEAFVTNAGLLITDEEWVFSTSVGHIMVDLVEQKKRQRSIDEIIAQCRAALQAVVGPTGIQFRKLRAGPPLPSDVEVQVVGSDLRLLKLAAEEVKSRLALIPGVYDIKDDLSFGKKDLKLSIDEDKAALYGLDLFSVASAVRNAYEGKVATVFREQDEEIDVIVKYDPVKVKDLNDIQNLKIMNPRGELIPFKNIGSMQLEPGYTSIKRFKLDRSVKVTANVDRRLNSTAKVNRQLQNQASAFLGRYPGCRLRFEGAFSHMKEAFSSLGRLFLLGLFLIYVILGAQFKSYAQPFIILVTIPFAFIGAVIALILTNDPFSIVVLYGFIGLAGIAVNDAIVMVSFINNARKSRAGRWRSIMQSGRLRLRPILLTSVTTMFGVFPLAVGLGGKSKIWAPMANTILWGLGFATLLTLFILPAVYTIVVDDLGEWWAKRHRDEKAKR